MKAQVIKINELFTMPAETKTGEELFDQQKKKLSIPLYQREFTWQKETVETLISDICRRDKFIGDLILEEKGDCYEIVDGQQRVTTCFLSLVGIFNYFAGSPMEQEHIDRFLRPDGKYCLSNASVGTFLNLHEDKMKLEIADGADVYNQKKIFDQTMKTIADFIDELDNQESVKDFAYKLLNSEVLVLINHQDTIVRSIEQVFLDINEKRQSLVPEEIFKGHCFKNIDSERHDDLREKWVELKKCSARFSEIGFGDLSEYLLVFILTTETKDISQTLYYKKGKKHILDGRSMDHTFDMLNNMIAFGNNVAQFLDNIQKESYRFDDIYPRSRDYKGTGDHYVLRRMCNRQLTSKRAQYQKIPLMFFVYGLKITEFERETVTHDLLRRIVTNLFVNGELFVISKRRKSNDSIDTSIWESFQKRPFKIKDVVDASKELRNEEVRHFDMPERLNKFDQLAGVYSIMDEYDAKSNWIKKLYSTDENDTLEHFIAPDNSEGKISWDNSDGEKTYIVLDKETEKQLKKLTINYLIMDKELNNSMSNCDIVTRIQRIKTWFSKKNQLMPVHMKTIINHVENMEQYKTLKNLKEKNQVEKEEIQNAYNEFLKEYASTENQKSLLAKITEEFKNVFKNQ